MAEGSVIVYTVWVPLHGRGISHSLHCLGPITWPRDQSLFVLLHHYMPTVNTIAIHNKLNKNFIKTLSSSKFILNTRPLESFASK